MRTEVIMSISLKKLLLVSCLCLNSCFSMEVILHNGDANLPSVAYGVSALVSESSVKPSLESATEPTLFNKAFSTLQAYALTGGTFWVGNKGIELLAQKLPVIGDGNSLQAVQPYMAGLATMIATYKLGGFTKEYFYTMRSGDKDRWRANLDKLAHNRRTIKEIVKEINCIRSFLIEDIRKLHNKDAQHKHLLQILNTDLFLKDVPKFIGKSSAPESYKPELRYKPIDILHTTHKLLPIANEKGAYDHWIGWIRPITKKIQKPFVYVYDSWDNMMSWDIQKDDRLLATICGEKVEDAAGKLLNAIRALYLQSAIKDIATAEKHCQQFVDSAAVIFECALVAERLFSQSSYENSVKRMQDLVAVTDKAFEWGAYGLQQLVRGGQYMVDRSVQFVQGINEDMPDFQGSSMHTF
jgi:hypothetical protein